MRSIDCMRTLQQQPGVFWKSNMLLSLFLVVTRNQHTSTKQKQAAINDGLLVSFMTIWFLLYQFGLILSKEKGQFGEVKRADHCDHRLVSISFADYSHPSAYPPFYSDAFFLVPLPLGLSLAEALKWFHLQCGRGLLTDD